MCTCHGPNPFDRDLPFIVSRDTVQAHINPILHVRPFLSQAPGLFSSNGNNSASLKTAFRATAGGVDHVSYDRYSFIMAKYRLHVAIMAPGESPGWPSCSKETKPWKRTA